MSITKAQLLAHVAEYDKIWTEIARIANVVLDIRGVERELGRGWLRDQTHFDKYAVWIKGGMISAYFSDTRDSMQGIIRFPIDYLETDFEPIERAEKARKDEAERLKREQAREAEIETMARRICIAGGGDPDRIHGTSWTPMWKGYRRMAEALIDAE